MAEENKSAEMIDDIVHGDIWLEMNEETEARIAETLERARKTRGDKFRVEEGAASAFDQVRSVLLRSGATGSWFVSNASTRPPRECPNYRRPCPLGASSKSCVLARKSCSVVVLRPVADAPSAQSMFPDNEVIGIKGRIMDCPHASNGARISVMDVVWLPKCERRPYEAEVSGRIFLNDGSAAAMRRTNNALRAPLIERLEPLSLKTKQNLASWIEYLDWRQHLLLSTKVGVRYIAARLDAASENLVFTVVAENGEAFSRNRFWERHEPVYACPLTNSDDAWDYRELSSDECRNRNAKKAYGVELGDYDDCTPRPDLAHAFRASGIDCPWERPYFADVAFEAKDALVNQMKSEIGRNPSPEDVADFLGKVLKLPANGFLTLSSLGDEILISRQRRALQNFAESGSTAAPFLSNYLFDITKARVPEKVEMPAEFRAKDLNDGQREAVATILAAPDVALVQGPPGTGKTTVIAEALWQFVRQGKRVLVVSQSGAAVDNALDRLANVPEIRAIRLMPARKAEAVDEDDSRYAEKNVLANFYGTLGENVRRRLADWERLDRRHKVLSDWLPRLAALEERLATEDEIIRAGEADLAAANAAGETALLPALRAFENLGVRVFEPAFNPDWPLAQRRMALAAAIQTAAACSTEMLPQIRTDIVRLEGLAGEDVVTDEDALKIAELKRQIGDLQSRMDAEADDDAYDRLSREQRTRRRSLHEIVAASAFDTSVYARYFTRPDADGRDVVVALSHPGARRMDFLAVLKPLAERLAAAAEGLQKSGARGTEGRLREIEERISAARARREAFVREGGADLEKFRQELGEGPIALADARSWCANEVSRTAASLDATRKERELLEPLYRGWLERLAKPGESDAERVLPEYVADCSIVGVTCTSDTRILEKRGFTRFDVVIVDEVSKATPPELLMAMSLAEKAVLVGDHRQLPPLFGDREPLAMEEIVARDEEDGVPEAQRVSRENFKKYERMVGASLFKEYFEQAPDAIKCMLWEQYRMHPDVMRMVNAFYDNRLKCGLADADTIRDHRLDGRVPWMRTKGHAFWIDSTRDPDGRLFEEMQSGSSKVNPLEVALMTKTLRDLDAALEAESRETGTDVKKTAGVIAFYGHQKQRLRRAVQGLSLRHLSCRVDTVDRFQGQERDYVLVSMTRNRANHARNIRSSNAYVAKFERINVAFSRARELLLVFGACDMFVDYSVALPPLFHGGVPTSQPVYRRMIDDLRSRGRLVGSGDILTPREWHASDTFSEPKRRDGRKNAFVRPYGKWR